MSVTKGLAKDAVASVARHAVTVIAAIITVPILARTLGAERLGFWSFLGTVAFLISLCDLGLNTATLRAATGKHAPYARSVAHLAAAVTAVVSIPFTAAAVGWLWSVADRLPREFEADARGAVIIAVVGGAIAAVSQPLRSYAQGQGYLVKLAWARAAAVGIQLLVTVLGISLGQKLRAPATGFAVGALVEAAASAWAVRDGVRSAGFPTREQRREIVRVAGAGLLTNFAVVLAVRLDLVVLERIANLATIGAYSVAQRIVDQGFTLVKQLSAALVPRLGTRADNRHSTIALGTVLLGTIAGAPLAALGVAGRPLIVSWAGPAVDQPILGQALAWYAAAAILIGVETVATSAMTLGGNPMAAARFVMIASLSNVAASVIGGLLFGPWAVAAGTTVGAVVSTTLVWRATRTAERWTWLQVVSALRPPAITVAVSGVSAALLDATGMHVVAVLLIATSLGLAASGVALRRVVLGFGRSRGVGAVTLPIAAEQPIAYRGSEAQRRSG